MGGSGKRLKDPDKKPKEEAAEKKKGGKRPDQITQYSMVRVVGTDLNGDKSLGLAITKIKGIGWVMSNAICTAGGFDAKKKLKDVSDADIAKIEGIIKEPTKFGIPSYMINRPIDIKTGKEMHLTGPDLDVARKFDIEHHINIKTYRGFRHMLGQPVRGQRTRSKFREKGKAVGVIRKGTKGQPKGKK